MPGFFIYNGKMFAAGDTPISPDNRSFRFGDGLFETIRVRNASMPLWPQHSSRLFHDMATLKFEIPKLFTSEKLEEDIHRVLQKNEIRNARIRITVFRGDGGLYDMDNLQPNYIIQSWLLPEGPPPFNENGLQLGFFPAGQKSMDQFANIKSNNFLIYAMAALHAKEHNLNDALVLNSAGRIADAAIANLFWVKDDGIFTTALSEGPVNGIMRSKIIESVPVTEMVISPDELLLADEVFLTNAVRGIQWVAGIGETQGFDHAVSSRLYNEIILPIFS